MESDSSTPTPTQSEHVELTDEQWRERLSPEQYAVLREQATERPYTGEYLELKDNGTYVCAVNRVGHEVIVGEGLEFWGGSFIADPFGRLLADEPNTDTKILIAKCDPQVIEDTRRNWPFLRDRRIDAYAPILSRYLGA